MNKNKKVSRNTKKEKFFCVDCGTVSDGRFWMREWPTCNHCDSDILIPHKERTSPQNRK